VFYWSWRALAIFSGAVWMGAGISLFNLGLRFLWKVDLVNDLYFFPFWVMLCLYIGFLKGRFVLVKSANRIVDRLVRMPQPIPFWKIYNLTTWGILLTMIGFSKGMQLFEVSFFFRGSIDLIVGMALIKGSFYYFKRSIDMQDLRVR
jgi:hypothetical protein